MTMPETGRVGDLVLPIYAHFESKPGNSLVANNFLAIAVRHHIKVTDLQSDIDNALDAGLLEGGPNGSLRLTEKGFRRMSEIGPNL